MLTVKHIEESGHEYTTSATSVTFTPPSCNVKGDETHPRGEVIAFGVPDPVSDGCNRYGNGRVYVMNDAGKTVAHYDLLS